MNTKDTAVATAPPTLPNFIASNLKFLRKRAGWSQAELARQLTLNRGNIASYESGAAEPNICKTLRISKLFNVSPRDLIRHDLSDDELLTEARARFAQDQDAERRRLAQSRKSAAEIEELVRASKTLFEHGYTSIDDPCPETLAAGAHYRQLLALTERLLREHRLLLDDLDCTCDRAKMA